VNLNLADTNQFTSRIASDIFGAFDTVYEGQQFHLHAGSEHTVDGVRHDLEMHTVHYPKNAGGDYIAAAMGIIFSVEDYTADLSWAEREIIDNFFESLQWTDNTADGPTVDMVTYGSLMELVDNNKRWIYSGSVTTPPCAKAVYWNVLSTIYPVSAKHLAQFKGQLNRGENGDLDERGNWRLIQAEDEHNVIYLDGMGDVVASAESDSGEGEGQGSRGGQGSGASEVNVYMGGSDGATADGGDDATTDDAYKRGLLVGVTILAITTFFGLIAAIFFGCKAQELKKGSA
jgi:hypothetical protein